MFLGDCRCVYDKSTDTIFWTMLLKLELFVNDQWKVSPYKLHIPEVGLDKLFFIAGRKLHHPQPLSNRQSKIGKTAGVYE